MVDEVESSGGGKSVHSILYEMRDSGILGAYLRADGVVIASTIAIDSTGSNLISSFSNTVDAIMQESGDKEKEIEIAIDGLFFVIIPINNHFLCGMLKDREEKKILREYAKKLAELS